MQIRKCHADADADANADTNWIRTKNNMSPSPSVGDIITEAADSVIVSIKMIYFSRRILSCFDMELYLVKCETFCSIKVKPIAFSYFNY